MNSREENRRDFDLSDEPTHTDSEVDGALCAFCGAPLPVDQTDYCDAFCAAMAFADDEIDRRYQ
jgi:hypothetical protein